MMGVYSLLPPESKTNSEIRQQYVNGHFCYAAKAAIVTNGLGVVFVLAIHLVPIPPMENVFTPIPTRIFAFIRAFREIRSIGIISTSTVSLWREPLTC